METIKDTDGNILAIIYRDSDWVEGLNFCTPDEMFVQVGFWNYGKDKKLRAHSHKVYERTASKTQESVYIRKGRLHVDLYDRKKNKLKEFILHEGDLAVFADGGHGYTTLDACTQVIEVKNGPFVSVDKDKEMISDSVVNA